MRVLLLNLPPLLRDILREALAGESDISLLGVEPDVVITQASSDEAQAIARELDVGLVAIDRDARHALVFARGQRPLRLDDISPTTIVAAIRSLV